VIVPRSLAFALPDAVGEAGAAAPVLLLALPLLQAAPSTAAPSTPPAPAASLVRPDTLLIMDLPSRSSPVWRDDPRQLRLNHCRYKYG
jgi:hypothetical protein